MSVKVAWDKKMNSGKVHTNIVIRGDWLTASKPKVVAKCFAILWRIPR